MEFHEWREKSKEEGTRYYRANYHAGNWRFSTTLKTDPDWEHIPVPSADLWLTLRDILWRRYQRKKGAWIIIERIDVMLENEHGIPRPMPNE